MVDIVGPFLIRHLHGGSLRDDACALLHVVPKQEQHLSIQTFYVALSKYLTNTRLKDLNMF